MLKMERSKLLLASLVEARDLHSTHDATTSEILHHLRISWTHSCLVEVVGISNCIVCLHLGLQLLLLLKTLIRPSFELVRRHAQPHQVWLHDLLLNLDLWLLAEAATHLI